MLFFITSYLNLLSYGRYFLSNERKSEGIERKFKTQNPTLSDLLRKTAELTLNDMIQLLFTRLPTFTEENLPLLKILLVISKMKFSNVCLSAFFYVRIWLL